MENDIINDIMGLKVGDIVWKSSERPFKSGKKEETIVSFGINEQDPKKRRCAIFSDGSTCNLEQLFVKPKKITSQKIAPKDPREKKFEKLLDEHEEGYAPWEMDEGGCDLRPRENMLRFARAVYNMALEDAAGTVHEEIDKDMIRNKKIK